MAKLRITLTSTTGKVYEFGLVTNKERVIYLKNTMKARVVSALMAAAIASITVNAVVTEKQGQFLSVKALRQVAAETTIVELPAKAAAIVANTPADLREKVAVRTVRIFLQGQHSLAPSLIAAIAEAAPEVAAAVTSEAVKLFPENAYTITKAAVAAAPKHAIQIAMRASVGTPARALAIGGGARNAVPAIAPQIGSFFDAIAAGERVETAALAIVQVKIRIGSSSSRIPADLSNPTLNVEGIDNEQLVFEGVQSEIVETPVIDPNTGEQAVDSSGNPVVTRELVFTIDTGEVAVPENLSGQDISNFDIIVRQLADSGAFQEDIEIEVYVLP